MASVDNSQPITSNMEIGNSVKVSVTTSARALLTKPIYGSADGYLQNLVFDSIRIPVHTSVVDSVWASIVSNEYRKK